MTNTVRIDETHIAIDAQHTNAGKALGARLGLRWMRRNRVAADCVVCVGDSLSDIEMADAVHAAGLITEFVFVGEPHIMDTLQRSYPIVVTSKQYEQGILEILARKRLGMPT